MVSGGIEPGSSGVAAVAATERDRTRANHSATHLLHAALRSVLGPHVQQKGSLVNAEKLRFDFSHEGGVSREQLAQIEDQVCEQIRGNSAVDTQLMPLRRLLPAVLWHCLAKNMQMKFAY